MYIFVKYSLGHFFNKAFKIFDLLVSCVYSNIETEALPISISVFTNFCFSLLGVYSVRWGILDPLGSVGVRQCPLVSIGVLLRSIWVRWVHEVSWGWLGLLGPVGSVLSAEVRCID